MCVSQFPRQPVTLVLVFLMGRNASVFAQKFCGKERNFKGESLWARGYTVFTVGSELEQVRDCMYTQNEALGSKGQSKNLEKRCAFAHRLSNSVDRL